MPDTVSRPWMWVFAVPPIALAIAAVVLMVCGAFEQNPFWPRQDEMSMAEAAALRDPGSVAWMIQSGVDPNVPSRIRAGVLDGDEHNVTPGEAAVLADRTEVIATLIARGARVDAGIVRSWFCLAQAKSADESIEYLRKRYPEWTAAACPPAAGQ